LDIDLYTLQRVHSFLTSTIYGGIWQSGDPLTIDSDGYIYAAVGNGNYNDTQGEWGQSGIKLRPCYDINGNFISLDVVDWFTPSNYAEWNDNDSDWGSTQLVEVPNMDLFISGSKNGTLYVIRKSKMGHYDVNDTGLVQKLTGFGTNDSFPFGGGYAIHSLLAWESKFGPMFYSMGVTDYLKMFLYNSTSQRFPNIPTSQSSFPCNHTQGGQISLSSNGTNNGILWVLIPTIANDGFTLFAVPGELFAFDPTNLTNILWRSEEIPGNSFGNISKFNRVRIYDGMVYVPTFSNQIVVYGMKK